MKKTSIVILMILALIACNRKSKVSVKFSRDIINIGDTLKAELYVEYADSILPIFNIINKADTFRIPFDTKRKCAIFQSIGRSKGKMKYSGYVEFINTHGLKENIPYQIEYSVE